MATGTTRQLQSVTAHYTAVCVVQMACSSDTETAEKTRRVRDGLETSVAHDGAPGEDREARGLDGIDARQVESDPEVSCLQTVQHV